MSITRTVLYYPTVQLPRGSWLNQSILYWDQIATIVPQQWDDLYNANQSYNEQNPLEYTDPTLNIFLEGQYVRAQDFNDRYITLKEHRELESEGINRTIRPERLIKQES
jgi:hypothetical protein